MFLDTHILFTNALVKETPNSDEWMYQLENMAGAASHFNSKVVQSVFMMVKNGSPANEGTDDFNECPS